MSFVQFQSKVLASLMYVVHRPGKFILRSSILRGCHHHHQHDEEDTEAMCKRKHLIWLFRSSPPTSKIKCYPSFPPYSQTLSLWSLLIHKWVCFKPNHKEKNLISIFWSCFVFFLARILPSMLYYSKSQDFSSSPNLSCKLWILNWNILPLKIFCDIFKKYSAKYSFDICQQNPKVCSEIKVRVPNLRSGWRFIYNGSCLSVCLLRFFLF